MLQPVSDDAGDGGVFSNDTPVDPVRYSPKSVQITDTLLETFKSYSCEEQMKFLSQCVSYHCRAYHQMDVPDDFLQLSLSAMENLQANGKTNVLYGLAKGLGRLRLGSSESCFPVSRMPFGLLEYMVNFFNSSPGSNVSFILL